MATSTRFVTLDEALAGRLARLAEPSSVPEAKSPKGRSGDFISRGRSVRQKAQAKGQRWEKLAQLALEALGCKVEPAPKVLAWVPSWTWPKSPELRAEAVRLGERPKMEPRSQRHDFFGVWDMIAVETRGLSAGLVRFVQVTDPHNLAAHRRKILDSGWPSREDDLLVAYVGRATFEVYHGPGFERRTGTLHAPARPRKTKARA